MCGPFERPAGEGQDDSFTRELGAPDGDREGHSESQPPSELLEQGQLGAEALGQLWGEGP